MFSEFHREEVSEIHLEPLVLLLPDTQEQDPRGSLEVAGAERVLPHGGYSTIHVVLIWE